MGVLQYYNPDKSYFWEIWYNNREIHIKVIGEKNVEVVIERLYDEKYRLLVMIIEYKENEDTSKTIKTSIVIRGERPRKAFNEIYNYITSYTEETLTLIRRTPYNTN